MCTAGIVGALGNGKIYNCTNNANVSNLPSSKHECDSMGGIVGEVENSTIEKCTNNGRIYGNARVGGISGYIYSNSKIKDCTNNGYIYTKGVINMLGEEDGVAGGIVGHLTGSSTIDSCYNTDNATVAGNYQNVLDLGGIVGFADGNSSVSKSNNKGKVDSGYTRSSTNMSSNMGGSAGGIVGTLYQAKIEQCYNKGEITAIYGSTGYGVMNIGGISGFVEDSTISNVYNNGSVKGARAVGGIIGCTMRYYGNSSRSYLKNAYNSYTLIEGNSDTEDIVGYAEYLTTSNVLWMDPEDLEFTITNHWNDTTCQSPDWERYYRLAELKSTTSDVLENLLKGDGSGKWAQDSSNGGYPYLINNP